jgi:hypothetical protein
MGPQLRLLKIISRERQYSTYFKFEKELCSLLGRTIVLLIQFRKEGLGRVKMKNILFQ